MYQVFKEAPFPAILTNRAGAWGVVNWRTGAWCRDPNGQLLRFSSERKAKAKARSMNRDL